MSPPPRQPGGRAGGPPAGGTGRPSPAAPGRGGGAAARPQPAGAGRAAAPARPAPAARNAVASPAQAARTAEDELERRFDQLDRRIQKLKVEYNRYFAGDLDLPPTALRDELEAEMRRLRAMNLRRTVDNFRLGALEAQLNSYGEMFSRRLRAREEGKEAPRRPSRSSGARHDVDAGVVVGPSCEQDAVEALFQGLAERNPRGATMDLDTFRDYLERQVTQIRGKTGCDAVQFRVVNEEGKVKLKAKPVGPGAGGGS
jgi:hypothetical protein